jgi:hypothetical protein
MSLLKRIEQGQGRPADQPSSAGAAPAPAGGGESGGGLSSLQARRVSAPTTTPQAGTYFDLKTRVQNNSSLSLILQWIFRRPKTSGARLWNCSSKS